MSTTEPSDPATPTSWKAEDDAAAGSGKRRPILLFLIVLGVLAALGVAVVVLTGVLDPTEREWPEEAGNRAPGLGENGQTAAEVTPEAAPGVYVWSGFDGWHVWVVNGEGVDGVSGTITSSHDIEDAVLSAPDSGSVSVDGKTASFDLSGDVPVTGIDFQPDFYADELVIDLDGADGPLDPALVTLGDDTEVTELPLTIEKVEVD